MVRKARATRLSRTMRPWMLRSDRWPHPSRRPPSPRLRRAPQDEARRSCGTRGCDLKFGVFVPNASSSFAIAPLPGCVRRRVSPFKFSPGASRGGWSAGRRIQSMPRLAKRGARLATTRAPAGACTSEIVAAIFRSRATLSKPAAGFDQPAPGGGFLVTPGWGPGTPGGAVTSRASRSRTPLHPPNVSGRRPSVSGVRGMCINS